MANVGIFNQSPTSGGVNGTLVTAGNPIEDGNLLADGAAVLGEPVKLALRVLNDGYYRPGSTTLTLVGATATAWALAPDVAGVAGTWGDWGDPLSVAGPLENENVVFWIRPRSLASEDVTQTTEDVGVVLQVEDDVLYISGRSLALPYGVRESVGLSLALPSVVLNSVGLSLALPYEVQTDDVGRSLAIPYDVNGEVGRSVALPHGVAGAVGRSLALPYSVNESVGRSVALPYSVLAGPFASDDFNTGTGDLVGTTPDVGGNWTDGSNSGSPSPVYASNRIRQEDAATAMTYVATTPSDPDYSVQVDVIPQSGGSGGVAGVCGRKNAGTGAITAYIADYYDHATAGSREWRLYKYVAGTYTSLGSYTQNIGTTATTLKLEMIGDQITLYVGGVARVGPVTDSSITDAGRAAVVLGAASSPSTNAIFLDNFVATLA